MLCSTIPSSPLSVIPLVRHFCCPLFLSSVTALVHHCSFPSLLLSVTPLVRHSFGPSSQLATPLCDLSVALSVLRFPLGFHSSFLRFTTAILFLNSSVFLLNTSAAPLNSSPNFVHSSASMQFIHRQLRKLVSSAFLIIIIYLYSLSLSTFGDQHCVNSDWAKMVATFFSTPSHRS